MAPLILVSALGLVLLGLARLVWSEYRKRQSAVDAAEEHAALEQTRIEAERDQIGGSAARPIMVQTSAVVEPQAAALLCLRCGAPHHVVEHRADLVDGLRVRAVVIACRDCGHRRTVFFQLPGAVVN